LSRFAAFTALFAIFGYTNLLWDGFSSFAPIASLLRLDLAFLRAFEVGHVDEDEGGDPPLILI
jgi:hypothetical protein